MELDGVVLWKVVLGRISPKPLCLHSLGFISSSDTNNKRKMKMMMKEDVAWSNRNQESKGRRRE